MGSVITSVQMMLSINYESWGPFSNSLMLISTWYCNSASRATCLIIPFSLQIPSFWILISIVIQTFLLVLKSLFLFTFIHLLLVYLYHDSWDNFPIFIPTTTALVQTSLVYSLDYSTAAYQLPLLKCRQTSTSPTHTRWISLKQNSACAVTWC